MAANDSHLPAPSAYDLNRVGELMRTIGGPNVVWGAQNVLDILVAEHQLRSQQELSKRLTRATWVLAFATIVLAAASIALIFVTANN